MPLLHNAVRLGQTDGGFVTEPVLAGEPSEAVRKLLMTFATLLYYNIASCALRSSVDEMGSSRGAMQREIDAKEPVGNAGRVLAVLRELGRPISAYDLLDRLRPDGVSAPTTVYRALKALIDMRLVHRLEALNAYVVCAQPRHTADVCFAICEACGRVDEVDDQRLRQFVDDWCEAEGFLLSRSAVELIGTCAPCRRADQGSSP
jgi:Fur family zinc uptake transcriptional regulator